MSTFQKFTAPSALSNTISFDSLSQKYVLLYFYPKDNTPGCTNEAIDFNNLINNFLDLGITIIGISPDDIDSHKKFIEKYNLQFDLISDLEKTIAKSVGAWGEKKNYGKTYEGIIRSTFLVEVSTQKIIKEWRNVRAKGHADRVYKEVSQFLAS